VRNEDLDKGGFTVECTLLRVDNGDFTDVEKVKLRTRKDTGVSTYLPIVFQNFGSSGYLDCTLHSQLISYRFCLLKPEL